MSERGYTPAPRRWPVGALAASTGTSLAVLAVKAGHVARTGDRWEANPAVLLDDYTADRVAIAAGLHPVLVWPDWADVA